MEILKQTDQFKVYIDGDYKFFKSENYNYTFNLKNGAFARWGAKKEDDPEMSPFGPEILDIEITTQCNGISGKLCKYCYKANTPKGDNMSFGVFKQIIEKVNYNKQLTQVAFGLDSQALANPDLWAMCDYLRENYIIPNGTVAQLNDETAYKIVNRFGGVAVSYHSDFEVLADTIAKLQFNRENCYEEFVTLKQINIHFMLSKETYDECLILLDKIKTDPRFNGLNAVVLLGLKKCGRAEKGFNRLSDEKFSNLVRLFFQRKVGLGFDSCSANRFERTMVAWTDEKNKKVFEVNDFEVGPQDDRLKQLEILKNQTELNQIIQMIEPCESGLFSSYINVDGDFYPCSFMEKMEWSFDVLGEMPFQFHWENGLEEWRKNLLANKRSCPEYDV